MTFIVSCHGKNFNQNPPPMSTIKALITNILALAKLQGVVDESECRLLFEDRELDKEARIRFANLPSNAKLVLKTGKETVLGHRTHDDVPASEMKEALDGVRASQVTTVGNTTVATTIGNTEMTEHSSVHTSEGSSDRQQHEDNIQVSSSEQIGNHQSLVEQVYIFNEAEMTSDATQLSSEIDYDINENDILMLHASLAKKIRPAILKTQKMRDNEMQRKLQNLRPAAIRIEFPHNILIQFCVPGNSEVGTIYQRLQSILKPEIFADLYLYTVPPKTKLLQMEKSIVAAGLLPAARLKVGFKSSKDFTNPLDIINPEFTSRIGMKPLQRETAQDHRFHVQDNPSNSSKEKKSASTVQKNKGQNGQMPKWLKLGSK